MQTNADVNACVLVPHHTDNETEQEHYNDMWILQANQNAFRAFEVRREKEEKTSDNVPYYIITHNCSILACNQSNSSKNQSHIGIGFDWTCTGVWITIITSNYWIYIYIYI